MENLREVLQRVLREHQRESGLHMVGGQEKLVQRLLLALEPAINPERKKTGTE